MGVLSKAINVKNSVNLVGAPSFAQVNPYGLYKHFKDDKYASIYPNIRPIVNDVKEIYPYAIDKNGKTVQNIPAVNALFRPNKTDSFDTFIERLTVSVLNLPFTYLLVWRREGGEARPGGDFGFKGQNIAGYTFLECPAVEYRDRRVYYKIGAQEFTEDEVMAIPGGAEPSDLYGGYSPAFSVAKWATIDGYIADFEKGFFENNAIPAGMFNLVAATTKEYEDMREAIEKRHRGAGNNNNVTFSHVPLDANGKAQQAQVEWIPFQQSNKDIDFDPILTHTDKKLGKAYGVSSIITGDDSQAKYSNAEVSEANYMKRAVKPTAKRIYSQITHELNRITGGIGCAITFKIDIPAVADSEKVKAETRQIDARLIRDMVDAGYTIDSIVDAFELSNGYKLLKMGDGKAVIVNDKPEVDEGNEVTSSPDRTEIDGITPLNYERHCSACDRFLGFTTNKDYSDKDKCPCKALAVPTIIDAEQKNLDN